MFLVIIVCICLLVSLDDEFYSLLYLLFQIMGRKANPDATYLDIEKSYYKKKGKLVEVEEFPFEGSKERKSSSKLDDLGLVRPVPVKGATFKSDDNKVALEVKKPSPTRSEAGNVKKSSVPNIILRKPTVYKEDDEDVSSRLRIRPNLSLQMWHGQVKEKFSDMTLLRKPEPPIAKDADTDQEPSTHVDNHGNNGNELNMRKEESSGKVGNLTLLEQPHKPDGKKEDEQFADAKVVLQNDVGANLHCSIELNNVRLVLK